MPARYDTEARAHGLVVQGALPHEGGALFLLGPDEPRFWPLFQASPEATDGRPDPLDRWSERVIGALAQAWGGTASFPSDGPPYPPFVDWALASEECWSSPVNLLVHRTAGLWISFRGAVHVPDVTIIPESAPSPCVSCAAAPCKSACPVGALTTSGYDVPRCQAYLRTADTQCRDGCQVRRACPVSSGFERLPEQSAFHLAAFLGSDPCA